ncbi:hypothetical protein EK21DRAFT_93960 [Setomelanomma holmii]|uniref:Uncharacterized protein n=1 Tax=Setomelanomma holmii TaxID=210430 RepID=A0A9P4GYV8_9PLEO|nr:hypothetical protein EK21DRAFT_93960 [Setomelanomma holmii]
MSLHLSIFCLFLPHQQQRTSLTGHNPQPLSAISALLTDYWTIGLAEGGRGGVKGGWAGAEGVRCTWSKAPCISKPFAGLMQDWSDGRKRRRRNVARNATKCTGRRALFDYRSLRFGIFNFGTPLIIECFGLGLSLPVRPLHRRRPSHEAVTAANLAKVLAVYSREASRAFMLEIKSSDLSQPHQAQAPSLYAHYGGNPSTYDHRFEKLALPVCSAVLKLVTGGLVVRWVTTGEYPLLFSEILMSYTRFIWVAHIYLGGKFSFPLI